MAAAVELSAAPSLNAGVRTIANAVNEFDDPVSGQATADDSIDVILHGKAVGHGPITDGTNGVGGAGSAGESELRETQYPEEFGRFHPRDELFLNGHIRVWNVDDAGVHVDMNGQLLFGVIAD